LKKGIKEQVISGDLIISL